MNHISHVIIIITLHIVILTYIYIHYIHMAYAVWQPSIIYMALLLLLLLLLLLYHWYVYTAKRSLDNCIYIYSNNKIFCYWFILCIYLHTQVRPSSFRGMSYYITTPINPHHFTSLVHCTIFHSMSH